MFGTIYSKLSYGSSEVQYFAAKNSQYYTCFPKLKHSLVKIVNFGFSVWKDSLNFHELLISSYGISSFELNYLRC